jgi:hypothetical protein
MTNLTFKKGGFVKSEMRCGEIRRSNRPGKKIMKKYCIDGKEKLVHAGAKGYTHEGKPSKSDTPAQKKRRANFKARHNCKEAKPGTPRHLACTELWKKGGLIFKKGSTVNSSGNYTKPTLRKNLFEKIKAGSRGGKPNQWSARKAQLLAKEYKNKGGGYKN